MKAAFGYRGLHTVLAFLCLLMLVNVQLGLSRSFLPWRHPHRPSWFQRAFSVSRGGDQEEVLTLDEKVQKAMEKLGIEQPAATATGDGDCKDGVCPMQASADAEAETPEQETASAMANRIAKDMNVEVSLALAALGATSTTANNSRKYNEEIARSMIQQELDMINTVPEDSPEVQQLVKEGYDNTFLVRRALAFSGNNMDNARAILLAEEEEEQEGEEKQPQSAAAAKPEPVVKSMAVDFDPSIISATVKSPTPPAPAPTMGPDGAPPPAKKDDVVFEATTAEIQKLVIESPVPVLLDIHAEWCGPCKVLGPVLEEMAVKAGGIFRLVKVNSDNERPVSTALEVTALPSIFAVRDGKIVHMFQGMPRSEGFMKNFMMGLLMPGATFDPPVTAEEAKKYEELSSKLAKTAGTASFSFAQREALQDRISMRLDDLVKAQNGDLVDTEESVQILRSLLSNIIRNPFEHRFRNVNLANKVLAAKVAKYPPCIAILKSLGFAQEDASTLIIGKGKRVVNVAPLTVARDYLDKWIDKTRYDVAKAARKRKDERALKELEESGALDEAEEEAEEEEEEVDPNKCDLKVRIAGKNKVHDVSLDADDPLSKIIASVPQLANQQEEITITCVAKRLVVKSTDSAAMEKSLRDYKLLPTSSVVVKVGSTEKSSSAKSSMKERAAAKRQRKTGSHTMQSIGVYAKDDNLKGELVDGGGGSLWEQDVTDDEEEPAEAEAEGEPTEEDGEDKEETEEES